MENKRLSMVRVWHPLRFLLTLKIGFFLCLNSIAALHSVPTAMFCVLHCLEPRDGLTNRYVGLERTIWPWGGGTDTIACMPGAIAGSRYGIYTIPKSSRGAVKGQRMLIWILSTYKLCTTRHRLKETLELTVCQTQQHTAPYLHKGTLTEINIQSWLKILAP